jgi:O-antigen/teichoic acid export membrane protein
MSSDNKLHIINDIIWYIPIKIIPALSGILNIIILTHFLSPAGYAHYSTSISIIIIAAQVFGSWLSSAVLYYEADNVSEQQRLLMRQQTLTLQILLMIPGSVVVIGAINYITKDIHIALASSILLLGQLYQSLEITYYQSKRDISGQLKITSIQCITQSAIIIILVLARSLTPQLTILAMGIGYASGAYYSLMQSKNFLPYPMSSRAFWEINANTKAVIYFGLPMCVWFFLTQIFAVGDRAIIQLYEINQNLGRYSSFRDLTTGVFSFLTMPLLMATHPIIMRLWKQGQDVVAIQEITSTCVKLLYVCFFSVVIIMNLYGKEVSTYILGPNYVLDNLIYVYVILSVMVASVTLHYQRGLEVTGQTITMAKLALVAAFVFTVSDIVVVPLYGVLGSSFVVFLSATIYLLLVIFNSKNIAGPKVELSFWIKVISWYFAINFLYKCNYIKSQLEVLPFCFPFFIVALIAIGGIIILFSDRNIKSFVSLLLNRRDMFPSK